MVERGRTGEAGGRARVTGVSRTKAKLEGGEGTRGLRPSCEGSWHANNKFEHTTNASVTLLLIGAMLQ